MKIQLGRELTERYERYADVVNQTLTDVIQEALTDWMDTCGEGHIELITGIPMDSEAERMSLPSQSPTPVALLN